MKVVHTADYDERIEGFISMTSYGEIMDTKWNHVCPLYQKKLMGFLETILFSFDRIPFRHAACI